MTNSNRLDKGYVDPGDVYLCVALMSKWRVIGKAREKPARVRWPPARVALSKLASADGDGRPRALARPSVRRARARPRSHAVPRQHTTGSAVGRGGLEPRTAIGRADPAEPAQAQSQRELPVRRDAQGVGARRGPVRQAQGPPQTAQAPPKRPALELPLGRPPPQRGGVRRHDPVGRHRGALRLRGGGELKCSDTKC